METTRNWLLPALLAAAQLAWLGPAAGPAGVTPPGPAATAAVLVAVAVETVALGRRRREPVQALAGALLAVLIGSTAWDAGYFGVSALIALYSVAVRRPVPVALRALAAAVAVEWLLSLARLGAGAAVLPEWAIAALVYVGCAAAGEGRRQWLGGRSAAARRLAGAEEARRRAGDRERRRLARELHDVSAHHLTSVVISADAALRLGGARPELTAEALAFAGRTGTETLTALQRVVGLLRDSDREQGRPMTERVAELIAGFGRLGPPVATELPGDLAGPAGEAVHGIVREALTNALRHAPGCAARVTVRRGDGVLDLTVENAPPRSPAPSGAGALGSGRGVAGMRERAAAVGGELTAGPGPDGGWRVRATLPDSAGPPPPAVAEQAWWGTALRGRRLADPALAFTAVAVPLLLALIGVQDWDGVDPQGTVPQLLLLTVLLTAHSLPLLWRRRAPWAALLAVLATAWLWPPIAAVTGLPGRVSENLAGGMLAEFLAVYAVAVYDRGGSRTWPAWVAGAVSVAGWLIGTAAADGALSDEAPARVVAALLFVPLVLVLAAPFAAVWGAGLAVRRRRLRVLDRDDHALTTALWLAERAADAERGRLAARLRDAVLRHTAALVRAAHDGRLTAVAEEARAALAAMRELLRGLGESEDPAGRLTPVPGVADLDTLCRTLDGAGRAVTLRGLPEAGRDLPSTVALSAYRIVEAALAAGDQGPARVTLRRRRDTLRVTVTGVPLAVVGPVAERLRVQVGAGPITLEPAGIVRVSLPVAPGPEAARPAGTSGSAVPVRSVEEEYPS
ncbi:sensor histidine kinase [Streptomyces sp. NPDC058417]|uniref:sensor histidine kinase n=3 Tax=Streptomyces TaxID=1883 RepID=UPI00365DA053